MKSARRVRCAIHWKLAGVTLAHQVGGGLVFAMLAKLSGC